MAKIIQGSTKAASSGLRIAVVISRFNEMYTQRLLEGCLVELKEAGLSDDHVEVYWVPGAFEIPVVVQKICALQKVQAVIALGAVIRGETPHFDYVCDAALQGIAAIARDTGIPVTNGIITADTVEQAVARSGSKHRNLGSHAALAALEMASLMRQVS